MHELDTEIREWAALPGPARFLAALRDRLVNNGGSDRPLRFTREPFTEEEQSQLIELFGNKGAVTPGKVYLRLAQQSLVTSRVPMRLQDLVEAVHGPVVTRSERKRVTMARKAEQVGRAREELLDAMRPVPQLDHEYRLLAGLTRGTTSKVPEDSHTRAGGWSSYNAAIRAAAVWWPRWTAGLPTTEKGLAATALRGSKKWTDASRIAFQNLVRLPFDWAVQVVDTEIRLRGPIEWRLDDVIVDARTCEPWVSLPAKGALRLGVLEGEPEGVLLIENHENFSEVCKITDVVDRWLCVWIKGFASDGLIEFVRKFEQWTIAAWCDLDPSGIEIIQDVMTKTHRDIYPVGMDPDLWEIATKRQDDPADRAKWQERATKLAISGPPRLRELASRMTATGERVEQEALEVYDRVIPTIAKRLHDIHKC